MKTLSIFPWSSFSPQEKRAWTRFLRPRGLLQLLLDHGKAKHLPDRQSRVPRSFDQKLWRKGRESKGGRWWLSALY